MNVHIQHAAYGYSVEWFGNGRTGRDYEATVLGAIARVSQLLRGDDSAEDDWGHAREETDDAPRVTVVLTDGSSPTYKADDAQVHTGGALVLYMNNSLQAIFASGTWRKALSQ